MIQAVQWTTGNVGTQTLAAILRHPDLEAVGCYAWIWEKDGQDLGFRTIRKGHVGGVAGRGQGIGNGRALFEAEPGIKIDAQPAIRHGARLRQPLVVRSYIR